MTLWDHPRYIPCWLCTVPGGVNRPVAWFGDNMPEKSQTITSAKLCTTVWSHKLQTFADSIIIIIMLLCLLFSGVRVYIGHHNTKKWPFDAMPNYKYNNILYIIPPPHSASCPSVRPVSAPVGGRKNTTGASCNGWNYRGCKWSHCANV